MNLSTIRGTILGVLIIVGTVCNAGATLLQGGKVSWDDTLAHVTIGATLIGVTHKKSQ